MKILFTQDGSTSVVNPSPLYKGSLEALAAKVVPEGLDYQIVPDDVIPTDRTFRDAWATGEGEVSIDMTKAKDIAHGKRRAARDIEFKPYDLEVTIPDKAVAAEAMRSTIRTKYSYLQTSMDAATTPDELKALLPEGV